MKKVITILFLLCFAICSPSTAQVQVFLRQSTRTLSKGATVKPIPFEFRVKKLHVGKGTRTSPGMQNMFEKYRLPSPVGQALTPGNAADFKRYPITPIPKLDLLGPTMSLDIYAPSYESIQIRGFVPQKHNSTLSILESQPSAMPKVNLDNIRLKVMMKQNRLNKAEMTTDEFIFIGLLIYHNEYGDYCITDYAA